MDEAQTARDMLVIGIKMRNLFDRMDQREQASEETLELILRAVTQLEALANVVKSQNDQIKILHERVLALEGRPFTDIDSFKEG